MGLPAGNEVAPERPIRVNEELVWDNGTPFPGDLRRPPRAPTSARFFAALGLAAVVSAKMPHVPDLGEVRRASEPLSLTILLSSTLAWQCLAPKVYPYDNLTVELGGWS
ncbi:NADH dehydrogenase [ubiquinone] 1 beta subcomplex subunit 8, mitochondrial isoform X1 [Brachypodium distachyon]|uniref:Uncharacterized protein n=1 Tax=Brachypodium distachyon TaxID=15368 RepID=A0A0Q3HN53_BRADI|nr:NADH dehydrogenase [ubiquinone] 1 beta subcomplex subunit 8, mitochondrial isoform X1 [Brachypodium distachyon]KQK24117.1 hypothetical protein BRADI_1g78235v3 [Brachypodium distachyon]KQK24118.1 hypothetical protein BRADI_1g78235v3 [Brachypodium distachyon]|eukprot:XP_010229345.1 NADH dehydrogenase [ubiquinone] 1 beta subcomplex subunit 8, mitochondrial isoform X1 [Brachypodium distachyon]